jgi:hypothetical protein
MPHRKKYRQCLMLTFACAGLAWLSTLLPAAAKTAGGSLPGSDKFHSPAAAASHCPSDTVVWSTFSKSKVFHLSDSKYFGKTKHGAYVCEKDAVSAGYHASKR